MASLRRNIRQCYQLKASEIVSLLEDLDVSSEEFDEQVDEVAKHLAGRINNTGLYAQVVYLLDNGWTPKEIILEGIQ